MSRIPDSFIQDLLARVDIVELIGTRLQLQRAGREYKARSPFTNEKTPSFFVNPSKQMYFDFSSGRNGNAISFLMEHDRLSFVEAVEELAKQAGIAVPREGGAVAAAPVMDGPLDALAAAERWYREQLRRHPPAIEYLKSRGLSGETAKRFGIGYAPAAWDGLTRYIGAQRENYAVDAGLLVRSDSGRVHDFYRNRVMFPVRDPRGRVITFGGRVLPGDEDPRKYLNGRDTPLFHKGRNLFGLYEAKQAARAELPYLLVVEGYMDVVMLAQYGLSPVVATLGTATTREHLSLMFKSTPRVVFCFDGDAAGRRAAWKALDQALPELYEGRECRFMFLPDGHDPDTLVQEIGTEEYTRRIEQALPLSDFLLGELSRRVDLGSREGRARLVTLAQPYLARLREGALRASIVDELARLSRLPRGDVEEALHRAGQSSAPPSIAAPATGDEMPDCAPLVRHALRLLLDRSDLAERIGDIEALLQSRQPGIEHLVAAIEFFAADPHTSVARLIAAWRGSPAGTLVERLAAEPISLEYEAIQRELDDALLKLRHRATRARVQDLLAKAKTSELSGAELQELKMLTQ